MTTTSFRDTHTHSAQSVAGLLLARATIDCRYLVIGAGRDAHVPGVFAGLTPEQVIHSTHSVPRIAAFHKDMAHRVVVVGVPQNAARCSRRCRSTCRLSRPTMVMRLIGLSTYESSKFTNKLYSRPSFCSTREITVQCPE